LKIKLRPAIERATEVNDQDQGGGIPPPISLGNKSIYKITGNKCQRPKTDFHLYRFCPQLEHGNSPAKC